MNGKVVAGFLVAFALIAGAGMYYLQVYYFYEELDPETTELTYETEAGPEDLAVVEFRGIDATSSPLRFRACIELEDPDRFTSAATPVAIPTPLNGPEWFDCFSAQQLGEALEAGEARAFLMDKNVMFGVDRIIAVFPDGRGYVWHQPNDELD